MGLMRALLAALACVLFAGCFDFDSAINDAAGVFLRDFIFNAGFFTDSDGSPGSGRARFVISASNTGQPDGTNPKNPANSPIAITSPGWYTFEHHFHETSGFLAADLSIYDARRTMIHQWIISTGECMYRFGTPTSPVATPPRDNCIALASVPVPLGAAFTW